MNRPRKFPRRRPGRKGPRRPPPRFRRRIGYRPGARWPDRKTLSRHALGSTDPVAEMVVGDIDSDSEDE